MRRQPISTAAVGLLVCMPFTLLLSACGGDDQPPSLNLDAGTVTCVASALRQSVTPPARVHFSAASQFRAGPVALPPLVTKPLPPTVARYRHRALFARGATPARVAQRTLILSAVVDEPSFSAALAAFDRIGVPYDAHVATEAPFSSVALFEPDGTCRYSSVVLSTDALAYYDAPNDRWISAFSDDDWGILAAYEVICRAREAIWYAYPNADLGMEEVSSFDSTVAETGSLTDEGRKLFPYLAVEVKIPVENAYGYRGQVTAPANTTPLVVTQTGEALVVVHRRDDGTEALAMTVSSGVFSIHSQLLEYGVIAWLQRDLFLGERRVYFTAQLDDVYLYTDLWKIGSSSAEASDEEYRTTPEDIADLVTWQRELQASLPAASSFITQLPFNGKGTLPSVYPDTGLVAALSAVRDEFVWINHTWDHAGMDEMLFEHASAEIIANCVLAEEHAYALFSCDSAITPHVSGLDNPSAVDGMVAAGVRAVVSDTSITPTHRPENPGNNPAHNVGRRNPHNPALFQVPRHPTSIFYSASLATEEVDLYNFLYRDWYGRDLSYEELLANDAAVGLSYLLTYDLDPLMFHQANLRFWDGEDGKRHSLFTDWVDVLMARYLALVNLPVATLTMPEIAAAMQAREGFDNCGASLVVVTNGANRHLELTTSGWCEVPVTGVSVASMGRVQLYSGVPTTFVETEPCRPLVLPFE